MILKFKPLHCFFWLVIFSTIGCGGPALYPVEGNVTTDSGPLDSGTVTFFPDGGAADTIGTAPVEKGKYKLMTKGRPGGILGKYKVTVASNVQIDSSKPLAVKDPIPSKYRDAVGTPLTVEIVASPAPGAYDLKISGK